MSGICGIISFAPPVERADLETVLQTQMQRGPDGTGLWCSDHAGLAHAMLHTTPESLYEKQPLKCERSGCVLVADARIDNRDELITLLRLTTVGKTVVTDADIILKAYLRWGEECAARLIGDFAIAIWDERQRRLFCARDHMGVKPLYYYADGTCFAFSSNVAGLLTLSFIPKDIDEQRLAVLLVDVVDDYTSTFYKKIKRLECGNFVSYSPAGIRKKRYWQLNIDRRISYPKHEDYAEAFLEIFSEAVRCRLRSTFPLGSALSGGLDSSSVTCVAAKNIHALEQGALHSFSAVFPGLSSKEQRVVDERRYMESVINHYELHPHFVEVGRYGPVESLLKNQRGEPAPGFNVYIHEELYASASSQGVRVFLDGQGGDSTVCYGFPVLYDYGRQFRFLKIKQELDKFSDGLGRPAYSLPALINEFILKVLLQDVVIEKLLKIVGKQLYQGMGESYAFLQKQYEERVRLLEKRLLKVNDRKLNSRSYHLKDMYSPFIQYDLEMLDGAACQYSLECRYPFYDRRLMEFCLAIPMEERFSGGQERKVLRSAMKGVLPDENVSRFSKANLSPNFFRSLRLNEGTIKDFLSIGALNFPTVFTPEIVEFFDQFFCERNPGAKRALGIMLYKVLALIIWLNQIDEPSKKL